jgi:perosamine synthetase
MIPVYRPYFTGREKEYVNDCLESTWISSRGAYIDRFEKLFAEYTGIRHATTVSNGTVALHLALMSLGIGPGDEVIVPTLTYVASANMIVQTGATPVFVDSLHDTWQVDPAAVQKAITPRTKAVMVVHLYGGACDMTRIVEICRTHNLLLVEDCAEAFGTKYEGRHVGTFGEISTFSFFGNKTITTGEGGMVITNDPILFEKAYRLKTQGVSPQREYWHETIGYNYRMTNICAAIGTAQIEQIDRILEKKRQVACWYGQHLRRLPIQSQSTCEKTEHSWWMYSILVDSEQRRDELRKYLNAAGIETRPLFPPIHCLPPYKNGTVLPVAEELSGRGVTLPSYPDLREDDVVRISETVGNFLAGQKKPEALSL